MIRVILTIAAVSVFLFPGCSDITEKEVIFNNNSGNQYQKLFWKDNASFVVFDITMADTTLLRGIRCDTHITGIDTVFSYDSVCMYVFPCGDTILSNGDTTYGRVSMDSDDIRNPDLAVLYLAGLKEPVVAGRILCDYFDTSALSLTDSMFIDSVVVDSSGDTSLVLDTNAVDSMASAIMGQILEAMNLAVDDICMYLRYRELINEKIVYKDPIKKYVSLLIQRGAFSDTTGMPAPQIREPEKEMIANFNKLIIQKYLNENTTPDTLTNLTPAISPLVKYVYCFTESDSGPCVNQVVRYFQRVRDTVFQHAYVVGGLMHFPDDNIAAPYALKTGIAWPITNLFTDEIPGISFAVAKEVVSNYQEGVIELHEVDMLVNTVLSATYDLKGFYPINYSYKDHTDSIIRITGSIYVTRRFRHDYQRNKISFEGWQQCTRMVRTAADDNEMECFIRNTRFEKGQ